MQPALQLATQAIALQVARKIAPCNMALRVWSVQKFHCADLALGQLRYTNVTILGILQLRYIQYS